VGVEPPGKSHPYLALPSRGREHIRKPSNRDTTHFSILRRWERYSRRSPSHHFVQFPFAETDIPHDRSSFPRSGGRGAKARSWGWKGPECGSMLSVRRSPTHGIRGRRRRLSYNPRNVTVYPFTEAGSAEPRVEEKQWDYGCGSTTGSPLGGSAAVKKLIERSGMKKEAAGPRILREALRHRRRQAARKKTAIRKAALGPK